MTSTKQYALEITPTLTDQALMRLLLGRRLSADLRTMCVIGAHRFEEKAFIDWIFPSLRNIYLFEPLAEPRKALEIIERMDPRVRVFPYAISDQDGTADFQVTNNDGESSSLLSFGTHSTLFPRVAIERTIRVPTRKLSTAIADSALEPPDLLIVDVQGAEFQVLASLAKEVLRHVRLIYTEVSKEAVYLGSRPLSDVESLLAADFVNIGFAPLMAHTPMHGNAVFVRKDDVARATAFTLKGHARNLAYRLRGIHPA